MRLVHEDSFSGAEELGPPWSRPLAGTLERLVVESELLAGNPLGDPARRPLNVLLPPGVDRDHPRALPVVYVLQGYYGQLDMWMSRKALEPTTVERLDALLADPGCPDGIIVLVDAWTTYGGSQFLDSPATGRYQSYLCDEIVAFVDSRYPTLDEPSGRGVSGHSSGGYGALVAAMQRPDTFSAVAAHAADALFEASMAPGFAASARTLRDHFDSSYERLLASLADDPIDLDLIATPLMLYGYAAAFSPDPGHPQRPLLPFDAETGRIVDEVWERWLALDPVRMAPRHAEQLRGLRRIHLEAGRRDEWHLDLAAQALSKELHGIGAEHTLELFDGRHSGVSHRYPGAIRELLLALAS